MRWRRPHIAELPAPDEPEAWKIRLAQQYGYSLEDLRRVRAEIGVWPEPDQVKAAAARRVAAILNRKS